MKIKGCVIIILLFLAPCLRAEMWGVPKVEEKQMTLNNTGTAALELTMNNIISQAGKDFDGTIRLIWADNAYSYTASRLRSSLIRRGILPGRVLLMQRNSSFKNNAVPGIEIRMRHIVMRQPECDYYSQNYRFNSHHVQGCAINNARNSAIIELNDYYF